MATFAYQLTYWAWVKLEKDELKAGRRGTCAPEMGENFETWC
jgi:hypothetical protein